MPASPEALRDAKRPVAPAKLVDSDFYRDKGYAILELKYQVPIDHRGSPGEAQIVVTVRLVLEKSEAKSPPEDTADVDTEEDEEENAEVNGAVTVKRETPIAVYLVGGPGSDNPPTANEKLNDFYLSKGFHILYMDYRGTGSSHLLRGDWLLLDKDTAQRGDDSQPPRLWGLAPQAQADLLSLFRQDNIVRDLEAVRLSLPRVSGLGAPKWTLVGQSYGGWVAFTYLSFYPEALKAVLLTGGIPPVGRSIDDVYRNTYMATIDACDEFYTTYPQHEESIRAILKFIVQKGNNRIPMPGGGYLSGERFLSLGRTLGTTDGNEKVHKALEKCLDDVQNKEAFSAATLTEIEGWLRFEERPLYAALHESIYTEPGLTTPYWAAWRIGMTFPQYWWLGIGAIKRAVSGEDAELSRAFANQRIYMSAEHVYPFHFLQFHSLLGLGKAADILATKEDWAPLFDPAQLRKNRVPIAALSYEQDLFINWPLSRDTATRTANLCCDVDPNLQHTAVKDRTDDVLPRLWNDLVLVVEKTLDLKLTEDEKKDAASMLESLP